MEEFNVPPPSSAPKPVEENKAKISAEAFRGNIDDNLIEAERGNITDSMRTDFIYSLMLNAPYTQTFKVGDSPEKLAFTFIIKTVEDLHKAYAWLNPQVSTLQSTAEYFELLSESELACYLLKESYIKDSKECIEEYSPLSFEERIQKLRKMNVSKYTLLTRLMLKFICRCEVMSKELVEKGFT